MGSVIRVLGRTDAHTADPQQRQTGAAFLQFQRNPPPGGWVADVYEQSRHYTGTAFLALSRVVQAWGSVVATLEKRKRRDRVTSGPNGERSVVKAVSPHGGAGNDEDYAPDNSHTLAEILDAPNRQETFGSLLGYMALQKGLTGEAPVWLVPGKSHGRPVELYPLNTALCQPAYPVSEQYPEGAWRITPYYAGSGTGWTYGTLGRRMSASTILPGSEVRRLLSPHPLTRLSGYSVFSACGIQMDILEALDLARHSHMANGSQLGTVIYVPGVDQATADAMSAKWKERYGGARNARTTAVVAAAPGATGEFKIEQMGESARELDFIQSWEQSTKFILAAFDVLPTTAGITEGGGYAERYAARQEQHERWSGQVKQAAEFFNHHLCRPWCEKPGQYRIKLSLPKVVNLERDTPSVSEMIQSDAILVNEVRALKDMKPINGGDLPPSVFKEWVKQKAIPQPQMPMPGMPGADDTEQPDAISGGAPPKPANPAGKGSLPPRGSVAKATVPGVRPELAALLASLEG